MNKANVKAILYEYQKLRDSAKREQEERKKEVYAYLPRIREIDREIERVSIKIGRLMLDNPGNIQEGLQVIEDTIKALKQEKAILLTENNIPVSYLDIHYTCNNCNDTGFTPNGKKCSCFKQKVIDQAYQMSNLSHVLEKENFSTFNIQFFSDKPFQSESKTPRENMRHILSVCESYAYNFSNQDENLIFYGAAGLGKTFLCNAIAKALLDKEVSVVYQTSFKILEILEKFKFSKDKDPIIKASYDLLFDCDLLIIDDLGTEMTNTFTTTELFNIINSRLIANKNMIISTNLSPLQLREIYGDRISSRIFGNFTMLKFFGPDLRWEKANQS